VHFSALMGKKRKGRERKSCRERKKIKTAAPAPSATPYLERKKGVTKKKKGRKEEHAQPASFSPLFVQGVAHGERREGRENLPKEGLFSLM